MQRRPWDIPHRYEPTPKQRALDHMTTGQVIGAIVFFAFVFIIAGAF